MPKSELRSYDDFQYSAVYREKETSGSLSPFTYLCTVLIIALLGLTVLYSSSYAKAISEGLPHYYYFFRNLLGGLGGLALGFVFRFMSIKVLKKGYLVLLPFSVILLSLMFIPGLSSGNFIVIRGLRLISPLSLALIALPFTIAGTVDDSSVSSFSSLVLPLFFSALLMILSLFSGGLSWYTVLLLSLITALRIKGMRILPLIAVLIAFIALGASSAVLFPERILSPVMYSLLPVNDSGLFNPDLFASESAIVSGGLAGVGLGKGLYKLGTLPSPESVYIFSSFVEELGYIGALALLFLLLLISIIGARTVRRAKLKGDTASAVLVAGFTIYIVLQSVVNMLYASLVLPLPGMLLPFFSYSPSDEVLTIMIASMLYRLIFIMGRENEKR